MQEPRPEPAMKASGLNSAVAIMREMSSAPAFAAFVDRLPPDTAALITSPRLATQWIPLRLVAPLYTRVHEDLFGGSFEKTFDLGREQLRRDLSTLYRFFLVRLSPAYVATRAADLYGIYAKNAGHVAVEAMTDSSLELVVHDRPFPSPAFFETLRGSLQGVLEMTRVDNVQVVTVDNIPARHRYRATWG